jgi:hypothetical protein
MDSAHSFGYVSCEIERERLVIVAALHADGRLANIEVLPILLAESAFAQIPSPEATRLLLSRFESLSHELATDSASPLFYADVAPGLFHLYLRDASAAFRAFGIGGLIRKTGRLIDDLVSLTAAVRLVAHWPQV